MNDEFDSKDYTHPQSGLRYRARFYYDSDMRAPQYEHDGHGVVTEQGFDLRDPEVNELIAESATDDMAMRMPLFKLLHAGRGHFLYYDTVASINKAINEWGCTPEEAPAAVEHDYEYLREWYQDDWHWMYITLTKLDNDGEETKHTYSLGGYESLLLDDEGEINTILAEMAHDLEYELRAELHRNQLELSFA